MLAAARSPGNATVARPPLGARGLDEPLGWQHPGRDLADQRLEVVAQRGAGAPAEQRARVADRAQQAQRAADLQVGGVRALTPEYAGGDPRIDALELRREGRDVAPRGLVARLVLERHHP